MLSSSSRSQVPAVTWHARRFRACRRSLATRVEPSCWPRTAKHSSCRPPSWPALHGGCVKTSCSLAALHGVPMPPSTPTLLRLSVCTRTSIILYRLTNWLGQSVPSLYTCSNILLDMSIFPGMIRLPKATKTPPKSKLMPRQSLATIVKDLGKNKSCDQHTSSNTANLCLLSHWWVLCLCSHFCSSETEGIQRTPDTYQQKPGQPASWGPKLTGKERVWQCQYLWNTQSSS